MDFTFLISKKYWFLKLGKFQFGNPDVMLAPKLGYSRAHIGKQLFSYWVWDSKINVLSKTASYKHVYDLDKPNEIVLRSVIRDGTEEILKYQSGYLVVYENGVPISRTPYWIDTRNEHGPGVIIPKFSNVPISDVKGQPTDINKFLDMIEDFSRDLQKAIKSL